VLEAYLGDGRCTSWAFCGLSRRVAWGLDGMHGLCVLRRWAPTKTRRRRVWGDCMLLRAFISTDLYSFGVEKTVISGEW